MSQTLPSQRNRRHERRRAPKRSTKVTCQKGAMGLGPNLALSLLDVSESGIRMRLKEDLPAGQQVEINLGGVGTARSAKRLATVVWSVAAADGTFCIGAQFEKFLTYADLLDIS